MLGEPGKKSCVELSGIDRLAFDHVPPGQRSLTNVRVKAHELRCSLSLEDGKRLGVPFVFVCAELFRLRAMTLWLVDWWPGEPETNQMQVRLSRITEQVERLEPAPFTVERDFLIADVPVFEGRPGLLAVAAARCGHGGRIRIVPMNVTPG